MRILLRTMAVFVAGFFVFATLAVVFFHPWGTRGMRASLYKAALAQERIYEQIPALVGPSLLSAAAAKAESAAKESGTIERVENSPAAPALQRAPEEWKTLLGSVMPPDLLRAEVDRGLDQAEQFLHSNGTTTPAVISLVEVKRRLVSAEATERYAAMLAGKPPCTPQQWEATKGLPTTCRPAPEKMTEARENHRRLTRALADQLPDDIKLFHGAADHAGASNQAAPPSTAPATVRQIELMARWSPLVPVSLALLIALLAARSVRGVFLWWGVPLIVVGVLGSAMAAGTAAIASKLVNQIATAGLSGETPPPLLEAMFRVFVGVTHTLMKSAAWTSVTLGAGGLAAVIIALKARSLQPALPLGEPIAKVPDVPIPPPVRSPTSAPATPTRRARTPAQTTPVAGPPAAQRESDLVALLSATPPRRVPGWLLRAAQERERPLSSVYLCGAMFVVGAGGWWYGLVGFNLLGLLLILLTFAGLYGVTTNLHVRWRAGRLLRHGKVWDATVTAVERKVWPQTEDDTSPPPPVAQISLRSVVAGKEHRHLIPSTSLECIEFAEARRDSGAPVFVLCDPSRPQHVILPETLW